VIREIDPEEHEEPYRICQEICRRIEVENPKKSKKAVKDMQDKFAADVVRKKIYFTLTCEALGLRALRLVR